MVQFIRGDAEGRARQFRHIVAFQQQDVILGIALWQQESAVRLSLAVEVGDIDSGVVAIITAAGKSNPTSVGRPAMIAVGGAAVSIGERKRLCLGSRYNL